MYLVCAILRKALTCVYSNAASEFFDLEQYFYLNVFRMFTLKMSKKQISENSCLNGQNYTSECKVT